MTLRQWQNILKQPDNLIVQNSTLDQKDGITASSIGMSYQFVNSLKENPLLNDYQIGNHDNLVLCSISDSTDNRRRGNNIINRKNIIKILEKNGINNENNACLEYFMKLPTYKFIISPEGNGIDCHRHYEALMAGAIPIVEDNPTIRSKYGNVPILYTKNYSEINENYLNEVYKTYLDTNFDFAQLFLNFWSPEEGELIKLRGNNWCVKLANMVYYK